MTPHVRQGDPPEFDPRPLRQVDPGLWDLQLGWGNKTLSVRGLAVVVLIALAAIVGSNLYTGSEVRAAISRYADTVSNEHRQQAREDMRTRCVLALSIEQRAALLSDRSLGAWGRACWWLERDGS